MRIDRMVLCGVLLVGCAEDPSAPAGAGDAEQAAPVDPGVGFGGVADASLPDPSDRITQAPSVAGSGDSGTDDEDGGADGEVGTSPVGDVVLRSRADLEALCALTDEIAGDLTLTCEDCVDVAELACLRVIGGGLIIESNPRLETLDGLEGVERLGSFGGDVGELALRDNPMLRDVSGLGAPAGVGLLSGIEIARNPSLVHLDWQLVAADVGFDEGWYPLGALRIQDNALLVDVEGIGFGQTFFLESVVLDGNASLERMPADTLLDVYDSIHVVDNDALRSLPPLSAPYLMNGVHILGNGSLRDLDALAGLGHVESDVYIVDNDALIDAGGLAGVEVIGGYGGEGRLVIEGNDALEVLDVGSGFEGCVTLASGDRITPGAIHIEDNASLRSIEGFDGVEMGTSLSVAGNPVLESLGGFESLQRPSFLDVLDNPLLPTSEATAFGARVDPVESDISGNGPG